MGVPSEKLEWALDCAKNDLERVLDILEWNPDDLYPQARETLVQVHSTLCKIRMICVAPPKSRITDVDDSTTDGPRETDSDA